MQGTSSRAAGAGGCKQGQDSGGIEKKKVVAVDILRRKKSLPMWSEYFAQFVLPSQ